MCETCTSTPRSNGMNRRRLLRGSLLGAAGVAAATSGAAAAAGQEQRPTAASPRREVGPAGVTLQWLGVAGWEFSFGGKRVLVDPWLTRFPTAGPDGAFDPNTRWQVNGGLLDQHIAEPELILITHGHYDHFGDVPYLARKYTRARLVGTETHLHLLAAGNVPVSRVINASGGEVLQFDGYTVEVVRSLHSQFKTFGYFAPGTLTAPPRSLRTISDLVEGGTLAYQVTVADRLRIYVSGATNLAERELAGLRPDVAIISLTYMGSTHRYLERLLTALGKPRYVVASHHDKLDTPLGTPGIDKDALAAITREIQRISPDSQVIVPEQHLQAVVL